MNPTATRRAHTRPKDERLLVAIAAAIALLAKAVLARRLMLADANPLHALALEGVFLVGVICVAYLAPRRVRSAAVIGVATVMSLWLMASAVFAAYFNQVPGPMDLRFVGQVGEVGDSVTDLFKPVHILFFADIPVLIALAVLGAAKRRHAEVDAPLNARSPLRGRAVPRRRVPAALAAAIACFLVAGGLVWWASALPGDVNSLPAATARGVFAYQLGSLVPDGAQPANAALTKPAPGSAEASATRLGTFPYGAARGKNLIVIQVEALQSMLIGASIDGVEVTPHLNDLVEESAYFPNTYTQISRGNTSDAEYIVNTGSYAPPGEAASVRWGNREVPSLPRLLAEQGYHTMTFHANTARFWNRTNMYAALGFDEYFDRERLGWKPKWKWGSSDEVVFDQVVDQMVSLRSKDTTFYAQVITMSTHHPFVYPPADVRPYKPAKQWAGTKLGAYLSSESYVDKAIGEFIADLKREGLWDESVVVIYGDHFGYMMTDHDEKSADAERQLFGDSYDRDEYLGIPLIVHVPGAKAQRITDAVGQVDVLATVADPLGLDLAGFDQFGRNAFVTGRPLVGERGLVGSGSVLNNRILFVPGIGFDDGTAYGLEDGATVSTTDADRADYEYGRELMGASLAYSDALPVRKGADKAPQGIIPNKK